MTASMSDLELAALIADLSTPTPAATPPAAAPPAEQRCAVTELLTAECAHCRPTPPTPPRRSRLGPWFAATYAGSCAGCGTRFDIFDEIRADGEGGYLVECCGIDAGIAAESDQAAQTLALAGLLHEPPTVETMLAATAETVKAAEGLHLAARPVPTTPPPSTVALMRDVLADLDASRPRSQQTALGPSELGTPCQRQIAYKLAGAPRQLPDKRPPWAPMQGTAVHGLMEEALRFHNKQLGYERWVIEERLYMDDEISGSGDAYDNDTFTVVDWKHVGSTALKDVKRKTIANELLVKPDYRVQGHIYGYGHERAGRTVHWIRLVLLARSHDYDQSAEWTERYDPEIAIKALDRYYATQDLIKALDLAANPGMWELVPATPGKACDWCPFRRMGGPADGTGCPGNTQSKIDKQFRGLLA